MKELTYILGAGASFESIPVVRTFPNRFFEFAKFIDTLSKRNYQNKIALQQLSSNITRLVIEFRTHQSFDTYFKKMFHTQNDDLILLDKKILNLYFIWEHLENFEIIDFNELKSNVNFVKQARIDKRYDALIAGLLLPVKEEKKTYCKVNFITWNYDLNLFCSLKNYFYPEISIEEFYKMISKASKIEWNIGDQFSVINMNGFFYSKELASQNSIFNSMSDSIICSKVNDEYMSKDFIDSDADLIRFSWESDNEASQLAADKIKKSKNIVVIGYTFPLYNRLMDLHYFNEEIIGKKQVFIQDPNAKRLLENVKDNFGISNTYTPSFAIEDCTNFFIPSNIFHKF